MSVTDRLRSLGPLRPGRLAPLLVTLIALGVYATTLMPGMAFDDWGEMQSIPHVLGIAHPTGYPAYILSAWLFELLPIGSVAWRANLLSAVWVSVALGALTAIGQRLGVRWWLAALAALATGAVATVWASAVVAEVNPLHLALMALLIHRSLVWADEGRLRDLALGGLLVGLGIGNHLLTLFVAPFFVLYALWAGRRVLVQHPAWLAAPALALLAGLSVYLYIPIAAAANPPLPYNDPTTFAGFRFLVTGEQFRGQYSGLFTTESIDPFLSSLGDLIGIAADRATPVFPVLGIAGLLLLLFRRTAFALSCFGALVVGIDVWANYLHLEHYLLVPSLLLGIGVGVALDTGANVLARVIAGRSPDVGSARTGSAAAGLLAGAVGVALVVALVSINLGDADASHDDSAENYVNTMVSKLPPNAAIFTYWAATTPLWYATLVDHRRPDLMVIDDTNIVYEGWGNREARIDSLICERPIYVMRPDDYELNPDRALYDLTPVFEVAVGRGTPSAYQVVPVYRVEPPPGRCG